MANKSYSDNVREYFNNKRSGKISTNKNNAKKSEYSNSVGQYFSSKRIGFDTLQSDLANLTKALQAGYNGWQTKETMQNTLSSVQSMYDRLDKYQESQKQYGGADLSELHTVLKDVLDDWDRRTQVYGNYKNADAYNAANKLSMMDAQYSGLTFDQVQAKKKEFSPNSFEYKYFDNYTKYDDLKEFDKAIEGKKNGNKINIPKDANINVSLFPQSQTKIPTSLEESLKSNLNTTTERFRELTAHPLTKNEYYDNLVILNRDLEAERNKWSIEHKADLYSDLTQNSDFNEKSKFVSTKGVFDNSADKFTNGQFGLGYGDIVYEYINADEKTRNEIKKGTPTIARGNTKAIKSSSAIHENNYDQFYPEEIKLYNYLYDEDKKNGTNRATEFLEDMQMTLDARAYKKQTAEWKLANQSAGGIAINSLLSVPASVYGAGLTAMDSLSDAIRGKEYNPFSKAKMYTNYAQDTREYAGEYIKENTDFEILGQNIPSFLYQTGMSMADNLLGAKTAGVAYLPLMGTNAFHQKAKELIEEGEDAGTVYYTALASGLAEMIFEKISFDHFLKIKDVDGVRAILKTAAKQGGIEASEEFFTELSNILTDTDIRGESSELMKKYNDMISRGYTKKEADTEIAKQVGSQIFWATTGGALSGGGMGTFGATGNYITNIKTGKGIKEDERTKDMIDLASNLTPEEYTAYETYSQYAKKGINADNIKNAQLGRLFNETARDAENIMKSKKSTAEQKLKAFETMSKLQTVASENKVAKEKSKLTVGKETTVSDTGEKVTVQGIRVEGNDVVVKTNDGEFSVDKMTLSDRDADLVAQAKVKAETDGEAIANAFVENYDGKMDLEDYNIEFEAVVAKTKARMSEDEILNKLNGLTGKQASSIYQATIKAMRDSETTKINEAFEQAKKFIQKKGTINDKVFAYDGNAKEGQVNWGDLSSRQREAVTFTNGLFSALGNNIVWTVGQKYTNGAFSYSDNTFYIDVNATAKMEDNAFTKDTIISTVSHELTHQMRLYSNDTFRKVADLVLDAVVRKTNGANTKADLIARELSRLKKAHPDQNYNEEDAIDEIVARACEDMLSVSKAGRELFNSLSESEQKTLANRIKDLIKDITKWIDELLAKYKSSSFEARALREMKKNFEEVSREWDKMLLDIAETNKAVREGKTERAESNDVSESKTQFQMKEVVEQSGDLVAVHNLNAEQLTDAIERGQFAMPSIAVTNKGHTAFGDISVVFGKETIDPLLNEENKLYGSDAWTPTQTRLKKNPVFNDNAISNVLQDAKRTIGNGFSQVFDMSKSEFKETIINADGSVYDALAHNIGMQTAYALKNKLISKVPKVGGNIDTTLLKEQLDSKLDNDNTWRNYKKWLGGISDAVITSYDNASNEDIINNMKAQPDSAKRFKLGVNGELTVPAKEYSSLDEYRANRNRLSEDAETKTKEVGQKLLSWANGIQSQDVTDVIKAINGAFANRYSATDIVRSFEDNGVEITRSEAKALQTLYKEAVELPTQYFEAKPQRAVSIDEIVEVVLPSSVNEDMKTLLEENNIPYSEYKANSKESRLDVLNSIENVRFSDKETEYLELAKDPVKNEARLNEMVREAAIAAGFDTKVYHGTERFGFTKPRTKGVERGMDWSPFFATESLELAQTYSGAVGERTIKGQTVNRSAYQQDYETAINSFVNKVNEIAGKELIKASDIPYDKYTNKIKKGKITPGEIALETDGFIESVIENIQKEKQLTDEQQIEISDFADEILLAQTKAFSPSGNYGLYANTDGMLEIDGNGAVWNAIPFNKIPSQTTANTREIAQWARENGYSGVLFKNIYDQGGLGNKQESPVNVYTFFNPQSQVKSADAVTYNAFGKVIPLSKRFNKSRNDIRYSDKDSNGKELSKGQQEYFKDSVVRDENGNLLVMYHGTPNANYTVFKPGTYFTEHKWYADRYQAQGASSLSYKKSADNPNTYAVYLDIKKPFDTRNKAERDIFYNEYYRQYGTGTDLMESGLPDWMDGLDLQEFLEEKGYDYDGLILDEGAVGGYGDEVVSRGVSYVTFKPEQVKNINNLNPTKNKDIRFQMKDSVEETDDLIAVHNLTSEKLLKTLKLGGLPMPSIAITRAREGWNNFGAISLVFGKETIDPEFMRSNKVYSGDAWTPTYPQISYKVNDKAAQKIREKINALVPNNVAQDLGGLHLDSYNIEESLNRSGDMVSTYRYNYAMKYAFLKDNNVDIELPTEEESLYRYGEVPNSAVISYAHKMVDGLKTVNSLLEKHSSKLMEDAELLNAIASVLNEDVLSTVEEGTDAYQKLVENPLFKPEDIDLSTVLGMLEATRKYFRKNGKIDSKVNYKESKNLIDEKVDMQEYESWIKELFSDIIAKEGIRNDKDLFTPSGNRRSFEALHYEHTLENVIKAMKEEGTKGIGGFGGGNILGASTREYNSIDDIKADAENRMQTLPESQYKEIKKGFTDRFLELAQSLPIHKDSFSAVDDAANMLVEAVSKFKTKSGMANYLRSESKGWANYSDYIVDDLIELVNDIRNMPVSYFEAKPQRAVGYDEIKAVVMPSQESYEDDLTEIKTELEKHNIPVLEYEYGDNNARIKALNSIENVRFQDKSQESIYDIMGENERLRKQNKFYKEETERLKERLALEKKVTNGNYFDSKQIGTVAELLRKKGNSSIDKVELMKDLKGIYSYIAEKGSNIDEDYLKGKLNDVASKIVAESTPETVSNDYAKEILKSIRTARVTVSETQKAEAQHIFGKGWNRNFFGRANIVSEKGIPLEDMWKEWAREYPTYFDENISDADMLGKLHEVIGDLQDASELVQEFDKELLTNDLAVEIFRCYWNISPIKTTADKYTERINKLNAEHKKALAELRQELKDARKTGEWMLAEQKLADDIRFKRAYEQLRGRKDAQIAYAKQKGKERLDTYKENAERKARIQSITAIALSLNDMLKKNSKDKHIPDAMKDAVQELLTAIDFSSKRLLEGGKPTMNDARLLNAFRNLNNQIRNTNENIQDALIDLYSSELPSDLNKLVIELDELMQNSRGDVFVLNKMNSEQLKSLDNMLKIMRHAINDVNKFHVAQHNEGVEALGIQTTNELDRRKKIYNDNKKHFDKLKTKMYWNNLNPYFAFKNLGPAAQKIFKAFQDGQDKIAFLAQEVIEKATQIYTSKEYKNWSKQFFEFEVIQPNGENVKFSMNVPQIMSLYCVSKQEDALNHILQGGGITLVETDKTAPILKNIMLTKADLNNIINTLNNKEEVGRAKEVADKLQEYMGKRGAELGNEISMARWGIKSFGIENYFPIKVSDGQVPSKGETPGVQGNPLIALLNASFTHSRNQFANQSIEIGDVFDVFANHMSSMIQYNAMALPVLDAYKWMNCKGKTESGAEYSVSTSVKDTFGNYAWDYLNNFMKDVNGTSKDNTRDSMGLKFFKNAKVAKVAFNIRVIALQFTSYFRASAVMDNKYLLKAFLHKPKLKMSQEKCGIVAWKSLGYYDTDITSPLSTKIKHADSVMDKLHNVSLWGAGKADEITLGYLWNACELKIRDTRKDLTVGSKEFYDAINTELRDVVYQTQVVDSTLTRSQMMRGSAWDKMLTSFASENALSFNLVTDVFVTNKLDKRAYGKEYSFNKNKKRTRKVITAYAVTGLVTAALQTMFDAFRDADEEDKDEEYIAKLMLENFANNVSIVAKLPYINLLTSSLTGFSPSRIEADWMSDTAKMLKQIPKILDGEEGSGEKTFRYLIKALSDASGVAAYNIYRDVMAFIEMFND